MKKSHHLAIDFGYYLSAYISASRSVLEFMHAEYSKVLASTGLLYWMDHPSNESLS